MKILNPPLVDNAHHSDHPPKALREFAALRATALDASKYPILARHWPGIIAIGDKLAVNDNCTVKLPKGVRYE